MRRRLGVAVGFAGGTAAGTVAAEELERIEGTGRTGRIEGAGKAGRVEITEKVGRAGGAGWARGLPGTTAGLVAAIAGVVLEETRGKDIVAARETAVPGIQVG